MRMYVESGSGRRAVDKMTYMQERQAIAVMDALGRLVPQEGADFVVDIVFKGDNSPSVSIGITPLTDKGEFWKRYVSEMIKRYPPSPSNPPQSIVEDKSSDKGDVDEISRKGEVVDA